MCFSVRVVHEYDQLQSSEEIIKIIMRAEIESRGEREERESFLQLKYEIERDYIYVFNI